MPSVGGSKNGVLKMSTRPMLTATRRALTTVALNTVGTAFLIGGSLWSIARRRRVVQNLWIGSGAAVVALSTGLTRAGDTSFVYLGELIGIALMFTGFRLADAPPTRADPRAAAHRLAPRPR